MKSKSVETNDPSASVFDKVKSILTKEEVTNILKKKISEYFNLIEFDVRPVDITNGYLGLYYTLTATVKLDEETNEYKLFVKTKPPSTSGQYDLIQELHAFEKEVEMYGKIIPHMKTGIQKTISWAAECYFADEGIIVLEDLSVQGYVMANKLITYDYDHCVILFKTLARFHSRSFILEEKLRSKNKTILDVYGDILGEPLFNGRNISNKLLKSSTLGTLSMIDILEEISDEEKKEFKIRAEKWCENISEFLKPSKKYKNVICHRDLWANNLLFKYDDSGKPENCCLVDLQFVCYSSPSIDCMFCLHLTTDKETRNKYKESFLRIYYETLSEELKNEGLNVKDCLEWSTFLQNCEEIYPLALIYCILNLPIMLLDTNRITKIFAEVPEFLDEVFYKDRSKLMCNEFLTIEAFRGRMTEALLEAYEFVPNYEDVRF